MRLLKNADRACVTITELDKVRHRLIVREAAGELVLEGDREDPERERSDSDPPAAVCCRPWRPSLAATANRSRSICRMNSAGSTPSVDAQPWSMMNGSR